MFRALENVVRNTAHHALQNTAVLVREEKQGGDVVVSVADQGPDVSRDELLRSFEPFFRGTSTQGGDGHGLGLAIVARELVIIDALVQVARCDPQTCRDVAHGQAGIAR